MVPDFADHEVMGELLLTLNTGGILGLLNDFQSNSSERFDKIWLIATDFDLRLMVEEVTHECCETNAASARRSQFQSIDPSTGGGVAYLRIHNRIR